MYKLRDWISLDKLNMENLCLNPHPEAVHLIQLHLDKMTKTSWKFLSYNPNAIELLEKNPSRIHWRCLSENPNAVHILEKNPDKIYWSLLSLNQSAIHLLKQNEDKIDWDYLSKNPGAIQLLENNLDKVDWIEINQNPGAIGLLKKNPENIEWDYLSKNPGTIRLLEKNLDKVNWNLLCKNPNAVHLIKKHLDKIDPVWLSDNPDPDAFQIFKDYFDTEVKTKYQISRENLELMEIIDWGSVNENPYSMELLKENQNMVYWRFIWSNPGIFEYDYPRMKETNSNLLEELVSVVFHPRNMPCFNSLGLEEFDYDPNGRLKLKD